MSRMASSDARRQTRCEAHRTSVAEAPGDGQHGRGRRGGQHGHLPRTDRPATDVAAPTRSLRLSETPPIRTASPGSGPAATAAGFSEASSTPARLPRERAAILGRVKIERIASREVYCNPWMTVREDEIRRPDGSRGVYSVVDKPAYVLVIAYDGDRFRLVEQLRYPLGLRRWELPQGTAPDQAHMEPEALAARDRPARRIVRAAGVSSTSRPE